MLILYILLGIVVFYFVLIFVILRFITPFMSFGPFHLPKQIPQEVLDKIAELEKQSATPEQYLKAAYEFVVSRWHAGRFATVRHAPLAFRKDISSIWNQPGYAHCNTQNYILFLLLAGSKFFKPTDIKPKCVFFNFFIHQYLQVTLLSGRTYADPAGASIHGIPLGGHIEFFG